MILNQNFMLFQKKQKDFALNASLMKKSSENRRTRHSHG